MAKASANSRPGNLPAQSPSPPISDGDAAAHPRLTASVEAVIELIRPSIQADGGDIELVEVTAEGDVTVRLLGACVTCPSSDRTLRNGIERQLRDRVREVRSVRAAKSSRT